MARKNVLLKLNLNGIITDVMTQTQANNVLIPNGEGGFEKLSTRLLSIATRLASIEGTAASDKEALEKAVADAVAELQGTITANDTAINAKVDAAVQALEAADTSNAAAAAAALKEAKEALEAADTANAEAATQALNAAKEALEATISANDTAINQKVDKAIVDLEAAIAQAKKDILGENVKETLDTLVEIGDWLEGHQGDFTTAVTNINNKIDELKTTVENSASADKEEVLQAIADTRKALEDADTANAAAAANALKEAKEALEAADAANAAAANQALNTVKEALEATIAANDTAINNKVDNAVAALEAADQALGGRLTTAEGKLAKVAAGATKVAASETNGNIKITVVGEGGTEVTTDTNVYTHPTTAGNKHIPAGGVVGQALVNTADGVAAWQDILVVGNEVPDSLAANQIFVMLLEDEVAGA